MYNEELLHQSIIERVKKHKFANFGISEEQLITLLVERPNHIAMTDESIVLLGLSDSKDNDLHWATDSVSDLISAIQLLKNGIQTEKQERWFLRFAPPEFVEPLCQIGFEIASHYMDYWLLNIDSLNFGIVNRTQIREAKYNDFNDLSRISIECVYAPGWIQESNEWFAYWLSNDNSRIFLVELNGVIAGYCCVQLYGFDSEKGTVIWIQSLAVSPIYQKRGFGKSLLLYGLKWGQKCGAKRSFIATDKRNHVAGNFYESLGYKPSGEEEINLLITFT